ncbi:MAG: hypothetical protein ACKPKO_17235, partial [Candidatus Fonsibacter sp.]
MLPFIWAAFTNRMAVTLSSFAVLVIVAMLLGVLGMECGRTVLLLGCGNVVFFMLLFNKPSYVALKLLFCVRVTLISWKHAPVRNCGIFFMVVEGERQMRGFVKSVT